MLSGAPLMLCLQQRHVIPARRCSVLARRLTCLCHRACSTPTAAIYRAYCGEGWCRQQTCKSIMHGES